jgi:hypothetical protein
MGIATSENPGNYVKFTIDLPCPSPVNTLCSVDEHLRTVHSSELYIGVGSGHWEESHSSAVR